MCCLFGILDHHASLSVQQRTKLLSVLATQSEVRGRYGDRLQLGRSAADLQESQGGSRAAVSSAS